MSTLLKVMCVRGYKKQITLPTQNWFKQTENAAVITYFISNKMRFITFNSREDFAEFLLENGYIASYEGSGKNVKMYEKKIFAVAVKGVPVNWESTTLLEWDNIKLYPTDIIHFASVREYEIQGTLLGLIAPRTKAKIRSINTEISNAA